MGERRPDGPAFPASAAQEVEQVGKFEMTSVCAEPSPEAAERWALRAEALRAWLLAEWEREHPEAAYWATTRL